MDSYVVGIFSDELRANELAKKFNTDAGSDQYFCVFLLPTFDVLVPKYLEKLNALS